MELALNHVNTLSTENTNFSESCLIWTPGAVTCCGVEKLGETEVGGPAACRGAAAAPQPGNRWPHLIPGTLGSNEMRLLQIISCQITRALTPDELDGLPHEAA
jgi:hypothetical protein